MQRDTVDVRQHFYELADMVQGRLHANEGFTLWLAAECSDFVRFNHGLVRQAGNVNQVYLTFRLMRGLRHVSQTVSLACHTHDRGLVADVLGILRRILDSVADDPFLMLADTVNSTEWIDERPLPDSETMVADIVEIAQGQDLVGFLAAGPTYYGFANHHGQRNWHASASWNFSWSLFSQSNKAIKRSMAGIDWRHHELADEIVAAREQLALLERPVHTIAPGSYRAFLAPAALLEVCNLLADYGGLSEKAIRTKQSPLSKLVEGEAAFSPMFHLSENTSRGLAPAFQADGFIKPARVELIQGGQLLGSLISPRTAMEFGLTANGASHDETPNALQIGGGTLPTQDVLKALGTGLYLSNLWYLNYSDKAAGRMTGMTRFACFWVENGGIVAPINGVRFDDSIYRMLGTELEALTQELSLFADSTALGGRSMTSVSLPGALLRGIRVVS